MKKKLEYELNSLPSFDPATVTKCFTKNWEGYGQAFSTLSTHNPPPPATGVAVDTLIKVANDSVTLPEGFTLHSRLSRTHVDARKTQVNQEKVADWVLFFIF